MTCEADPDIATSFLRQLAAGTLPAAEAPSSGGSIGQTDRDNETHRTHASSVGWGRPSGRERPPGGGIRATLTSVAGQDFLDEIVHERSKQNPEFVDLVKDALERRVADRGRETSGSAAPPLRDEAASDDAVADGGAD